MKINKESEIKVCRICFDEEIENKKLIIPCLCKGTSKYVHQECLAYWISTQEPSNSPMKCEICKYHIKVEIVNKSKCDPKEGVTKNPQLICYILILLLIIVFILTISYVILTSSFSQKEENLPYVIGIFVIFFLIFFCSASALIKLFRQVCLVSPIPVYKIHPINIADDGLNTTYIGCPEIKEPIEEINSPTFILNE